jgi:secreted PhoX family phosphatase
MEQKKLNRRSFIELITTLGATYTIVPMALASCTQQKWPTTDELFDNRLKGIQPSLLDDVVLADGLQFRILIQFNEDIGNNEKFGFNNDFLSFLPDSSNPSQALLWVNHEYVNTQFVSKRKKGDVLTKELCDLEMYHVGGSILHLDNINGEWTVNKSHASNKRFNGHTPFTFSNGVKIQGTNEPIGTLANCAGGQTPWGTFLSCEENYDSCFGERDWETMSRIPSYMGWEMHYNYPPEHYGWVVEIDPQTGQGIKHVALGRCAHESATVVPLDNGLVAVYTGDDQEDQCLYKFISSEKNALNHGTLYVANIEQGQWIPVVWDQHKVLQEKFKDQTEVLIRLREASDLLGGSKLDRPEDIEIDPLNGDVYVALTNNKPKGNHFGSILRIVEENGKHDALVFKAEQFRAGGPESNFACPDNMVFDKSGNLWFTSDISGSKINKEPYTPFGNNGLFVIPRHGLDAGKVIQVASGPVDAEFTGPCFSPDQKTLFLCVQHPGENSPGDLSTLTSHWPSKNGIPSPAVIAITGDVLTNLTQINLPEEQ